MAKADNKKPKQSKKTAVKNDKKVSTKKIVNKADKKVVGSDSTKKRTGLKKVFRSPFRGYFMGAWRELKEVTWPDRKTTWKFTLIVIMVSVLFSAFTAGLDVGFEKLAKQIFLK